MFKCVECSKEKEDSEFYKAKNKRGLTSKCKYCIKKQVKRYREDNIEKVREYDRNRPNHEERIENCKERYKEKRERQDEVFLEKDRERIRKYRKANPEKYKAQCAVNNALRGGKLIRPSECSCCGNKKCKPQGHHWSYEQSHWLEVVWLCPKCHAEEHKRLREEGKCPDIG